MVAMEEKVLHNCEKFDKREVDKDHDKKKAIMTVKSLLDKATATSKKKDGEIDKLHKEFDQLCKKLEIAESLKATINMTKGCLVDDHSEISLDKFDKYLKKCRAADLATATSKKKDGEIDQLHKEVDQLCKKLEIAESLKATINMTKEWLVDDHSEISPDEFDKYFKKCQPADLTAQKVGVTYHGRASSIPDGFFVD
ncbi:hypothetical protein Adt_40757 [Abeliophyllum distichum]|uniref:Uncharacterized protein n=1 Tax=Abeliophyllum distichum TaxID=126358 RepID=A0ABD1PQS5_9LAMI